MLDTPDLRILSAWCRTRALRWQPAAGVDRLTLEPASGRRAWARMILRLDDEGFRLEDEAGELLATASDLPAVLDALDGGVAEPRAVDRALRAGFYLGQAPVDLTLPSVSK